MKRSISAKNTTNTASYVLWGVPRKNISPTIINEYDIEFSGRE